METKITLREIAKQAGVNPSTVSRALNPATALRISPEQRARICAICEAHHYRPKLSARSTATGRTYKIGLVLGAIEQDLGSPLFGRFVRGMCGVLQSRGYALTILWAGRPGSDLDREVAGFLESEVADGYVFGASLLDNVTREAALRCGRPVAVLDNYPTAGSPETFLRIMRTDGAAYRAAWDALPESARSRAAFFGPESPSSRYKYASARSSMPPGAHCDDIFFETEHIGFIFDRENARFFAEGQSARLAGYDVFFCASDLTALGLMDILKKHRREPGKDVFVIGYDNLESVASAVGFPTIATPWEESGRIAAQSLLAVLDGGIPPSGIEVPSTYIHAK